MQRSSRVDYDVIAELYDSTPHREKSADPELIAFLAGRGPTASVTLLDIACGTGNQQIANRDLAPDSGVVKQGPGNAPTAVERQIREQRKVIALWLSIGVEY
jgi:hypothetical protein